jgi:hypothetical protein
MESASCRHQWPSTSRHSADAIALDLLKGYLFLLTADELPDFIYLNPLAMEIDHRFIQEVCTRRAKLYKQLQDGVLGRTSHSNCGVNRISLNQAADNLGTPCTVFILFIYTVCLLGLAMSIENCILVNVYAASGLFFHLAFAAFFAILLRCFAVRLSALALPPLDAPSFESATACGFLTRVGFSFGLSHFSPMIFSITALANRTGSLGAFFGFFGLLARESMVRLWHTEEANDLQNYKYAKR